MQVSTSMTTRALLVAKLASHAGARPGGNGERPPVRALGQVRVTVRYAATDEGETVAWRVLPRRVEMNLRDPLAQPTELRLRA
jgi:hypothetical protein